MEFPAFIHAFPALAVPLSADQVTTRAIRSDKGLVVFFTFHQDVEMPAHSHKGQWGTVIAGEVAFTIEGKTKTYRPGESYFIQTGVVHAVKVKAGSKVVDVFEEPDRYPLVD